MSQSHKGEEVCNAASAALHGDKDTPWNKGMADMLTPPEAAGLLGDDFRGVIIDWSISQPADAIYEKSMKSGGLGRIEAMAGGGVES